ncbi:MAG: hypothetical protein CMF49_05305 [Legionellales bacterium]|nr:hypothetical protein [Legionellales bacterium]
MIEANGSISPAVRCRNDKSLSLDECEEISRGIAAQQTIRQVAANLKRSPSTISREIN